jgi:hypothetical protein
LINIVRGKVNYIIGNGWQSDSVDAQAFSVQGIGGGAVQLYRRSSDRALCLRLLHLQ